MHAEVFSSRTTARCFSDVLSDFSSVSLGLLQHEVDTVVNVASLFYKNPASDGSGPASSASARLPRVVVPHQDAPEPQVVSPDSDTIRDVIAVIQAVGVDQVFSGSPDDVCINAACIATALREADVFAQLRPKLLQPFRGADKMFEVASQLKQLLDRHGLRSEAMHAVSSSGLEGLELRTLAAAALLLFDDASKSTDSAPVVGKGASDPAAVPASVLLQAPNDKVMRKLRSAVVANGEDLLEDLEVVAGTSDAAVWANSATIFLVLKSDPDFSNVEPRLSSLLSVYPESLFFVSVFQQLHELNSFVGSLRKNLSQVLKLCSLAVSRESVALSTESLAVVCNVAALLFL
jgi:hypothetical protein